RKTCLLWTCLLLGACGGGGDGMVGVDSGSPDATPAGSTGTDVRMDIVRRDTAPGGDGRTDTTTGQDPDTGGGNSDAPLMWAPFGPISAPAQTILEMNVTSVPVAGGATIMTLNADNDPSAKVPV